MQLNELKPKTARKTKKRVGRGGKRGTFSGRGTKGQKARAGHRIRPEMRDIIKKIPKLRGYRSKIRSHRIAVVNIGALNKHFQDGETVTPEALAKKGLLHRRGGKIPEVKLLGSGEVGRKLLVKNCQLSATAKTQIEKAGGSVAVKMP
ncbi:MAG: 50S ribosomal protein L15 [Candidatus Niyogibacteria bacterium]|nr:50S ribosomal protein L15 [Candidatus Niyogibacteria bacterium]